jgi:hypothetical protein
VTPIVGRPSPRDPHCRLLFHCYCDDALHTLCASTALASLFLHLLCCLQLLMLRLHCSCLFCRFIPVGPAHANATKGPCLFLQLPPEVLQLSVLLFDLVVAAPTLVVGVGSSCVYFTVVCSAAVVVAALDVICSPGCLPVSFTLYTAVGAALWFGCHLCTDPGTFTGLQHHVGAVVAYCAPTLVVGVGCLCVCFSGCLRIGCHLRGIDLFLRLSPVSSSRCCHCRCGSSSRCIHSWDAAIHSCELNVAVVLLLNACSLHSMFCFGSLASHPLLRSNTPSRH